MRRALICLVWLGWFLADTAREVWPKEKRMPPPDTDGAAYYELVLTGSQRDYVLKALRGSPLSTGPADVCKKAIEAVELAKPTELVPAGFDWDELDRLAAERHCSPADVLWDLGRGREAD